MLGALPYHLEAVNYFRRQSSAWQFFADQKHKAEQLREFKGELLKNTYRFNEDSDVQLYEMIAFAKDKLGLSLPVYAYQAQNSDDINASIVYLNHEAHIVFSGKILQSLTGAELQAIIAHELSHVQLYSQSGGDVEVADRIVTAIANHHGSTPAHYETARLFNLYTEIFCDRGAYIVTADYKPIISSLLKISTGLQTVNVDNFIKQADEIFSGDVNTKTAGVSHPENFIRARAIWLWHIQGADAEPVIRQMMEGPINLEELDLFRQQQVAQNTKQLIELILKPKWMRTAHTVALAKQYFAHIGIPEEIEEISVPLRIPNLLANTQDYLAYVLYDFSTADKSLEDIPLGYCFSLADGLHLGDRFLAAVKKERKMSDKKVATFKKHLLEEYKKLHFSQPDLPFCHK